MTQFCHAPPRGDAKLSKLHVEHLSRLKISSEQFDKITNTYAHLVFLLFNPLSAQITDSIP